MKQDTFNFEGKEYKYSYPEALEKELKTQISELFKTEYYKAGRRKKDAVYLDIGANIGMATTYFQPYAKKIYSIEPNPQLFRALETNTTRFPQVEKFNVAIGAYSTPLPMYSNNGGSIPQTIFPKDTTVDAIMVTGKSLEDFMNENKIEHVDVMKIDVEEAEYVIFASDSFAAVSDRIDFIIGEAHFQENGGFPDVLPLILDDLGFETKYLDLPPNYYRNFTFTDMYTGIRKKWSVPYKTIFTAKRRKK